MTLSSVLLPEPDGPITEMNSPSSTAKLILLKARVSTCSVRYTFSMLSSLIMAVSFI